MWRINTDENLLNRIEKQSFAPDRSWSRLLWFGIWFFVVFAILSIGLAVVESIESPENKGALVVYAVMTLLFGGFAYMSHRGIKQLEEAPVSLDEDGVWRDKIGKSQGLVRWEDISSIKERQYGQQLELIGIDGSVLVKLEYQLADFERVREIVLSKVRRSDAVVECPAVFKKSMTYHVFTVGLIVGFAAFGYYVSQIHLFLGILLLLVVVLLSAVDYLKTVSSLIIDRRAIHVRYPLWARTYDVSEVNSIQMSDQFIKGSRLPEVIVSTHSHSKPFRLKQLGVDASTLYDLLKRWKDEKLFLS